MTAGTGVYGGRGCYVEDGVEGADEVGGLKGGGAGDEMLDVAGAGEVEDFEEAHGVVGVLR